MNHASKKRKVLTVPNALSFFRLCLIPVFVWLYCVKHSYEWTGTLLMLSGLTDMVDGFIARKFDATSDVGKILDPIADKLTQGAMLFCLLTRFPRMWVPLALLIVKELFMGLTGLMVIRKTRQVFSALWHGKVATCLLYAMMILHVMWPGIPRRLSDASVGACVAMMLISVVLYGCHNIQILRGKAARRNLEQRTPPVDEMLGRCVADELDV